MIARILQRLQLEPGSEGFIIVAVLWILAALATLATIIAVYVINAATAFTAACVRRACAQSRPTSGRTSHATFRSPYWRGGICAGAFAAAAVL